MTYAVSSHVSDHKGVLTLSGRFDFSIHQDFRGNYENVLSSEGINTLDIDLGGVEYIDSSALGMLLLLREKALSKDIKITLTNSKNSVRKVLEMANFGRLFSII